MHVVNDNEKSEAGDTVVGIENTKGRNTDFLERLVFKGNDNTLKKVLEDLGNRPLGQRRFLRTLVTSRRSAKDGGHHGQCHTGQSHVYRNGAGALGRGGKPVGVVENDPKPGRDDPGPLTYPLGDRHQASALVVVLAHFVAHGHVGNAEYGHADEEHNRPAEKIPEVIHLAVLCRQLPHRHIGNAGHDRPDKYIGSPLAPAGLGAVRDIPHQWIGDRINQFWQEEDQTPQDGAHTQALHQYDHENAQCRREHLVGQHAKTKSYLLAHGNTPGLRLRGCNLNTHVHCLAGHMTLTSHSPAAAPPSGGVTRKGMLATALPSPLSSTWQ